MTKSTEKEPESKSVQDAASDPAGAPPSQRPDLQHARQLEQFLARQRAAMGYG